MSVCSYILIKGCNVLLPWVKLSLFIIKKKSHLSKEKSPKKTFSMPNQFININFVKPNLRLNVLYTYYLSKDKKNINCRLN